MSYGRLFLRLGAAVACCAAMSACVTPAEQQKKLEVMMPPPVTKVSYYPACYQPISQLRATYQVTYRATVDRMTAEGARRGAQAGTRRPGQINLVGLVLGAVVANLEADAVATKQLVDNTVNTARSARACYDKEFASLMSRVRAKKIPRSEAEARLDEITHGFEETAMMLGDAVTTADRQQVELNRALAERGGKPATVTQVAAKDKDKVKATTTAQPTAKDAEAAILADSSAELNQAQTAANSEKVSAEESRRKAQNAKLALES